MHVCSVDEFIRRDDNADPKKIQFHCHAKVISHESSELRPRHNLNTIGM